MNLKSANSAWAVATVVLGVTLGVGLNHRAVSAQGAAGSEPLMEDAFENITVLNGEPAHLMLPTMFYFEAALGVGCPYCHDPDNTKRDLDTNELKDVARDMVTMVNTLNANNFSGEEQVTCFTCHQGQPVPGSVPVVINAEVPPKLEYTVPVPAPAAIPSLTAAQIFDKYIAAVGGASALQNVSGLTAAGTVTQRRPGRNLVAQQFEITAKTPAMKLTATQAGQNQNLVAYSGGDGWARGGNGNVRDLRPDELDAARLEDAFNLPAQLTQLISDAQTDHPEVVGHRELYVVSGRTEHLPRVKLYFEKDTGMLVRLVYFIDTPFGPYPTQVDFADFRDVDGRTVPYSWIVSQSRGREYTYAMQNVRAAEVDGARFVRPAANVQ
jgi:hypothetical protein